MRRPLKRLRLRDTGENSELLIEMRECDRILMRFRQCFEQLDVFRFVEPAQYVSFRADNDH